MDLIPEEYSFKTQKMETCDIKDLKSKPSKSRIFSKKKAFNYIKYKYLFEAFASLEELEKLAPPQPVYENWAIVNEEGERLEIGLPGIFKQDDALHVMWRYY